jgi:ribosomal protein S18 acetylase RimI-like enzyme
MCCSFVLFEKVVGKAEGQGEKWHGHVTAVTVAPEFRRLGIARKLMNILELVSEKMYFNQTHKFNYSTKRTSFVRCECFVCC